MKNMNESDYLQYHYANTNTGHLSELIDCSSLDMCLYGQFI